MESSERAVEECLRWSHIVDMRQGKRRQRNVSHPVSWFDSYSVDDAGVEEARNTSDRRG